ncbi:MAG: hypothetical protein JRG96_01350 [Deltaproteobacteria bacterium]|nr:hypothetical protein [Deltaproteobacteria bacterium]MBW2418717.1 hypothetical protein [Deltaproteobacteria bacterium]
MDLIHTAHVPAGDGPFPTLFAFHGWGANAHDLLGLAPYLHGRESRDRLIAMGASPTYREYEMGHEIRGETLRDLVEWLDDKVLRSIELA